ncbi:MAG: hypothetical protein E7618_02345 [Ruminococcaceae bacterium]|nr:hypothetical protein [Oscillospiraceae bacterium]
MKKFTAILLSAMLLITLAVSVSAAADISGVSKSGYTAYPLFDAEGNFTTGVSVFHKDGAAVTPDELKSRINQGWDSNTFKDAGGSYEMIIWTNAGHYAFGQGIRQISNESGSPYVEIVFTGTGIRLGTCYRTDAFGEPEAKIMIDGAEVETDPTLLWADWADDTTPTIFFEAEDLANTTHTLRIYAVGEVEWDWFEVNGTLGAPAPETQAPTTQAPATSDNTTVPPQGDNALALTVLAAASAIALAIVIKKKH